MAEFNVLVTDYAWPSLDLERRILAAVGAGLTAARTGDEDELVALAPEADAILTCWKPVTGAVLDVARHCRVVSRYGIGLDNIAVDRATELGMAVTNVPDFCLDEVSDHAMALLLACSRRVVRCARQTRGGTWDPGGVREMPRLRGQTLGLIGHGNIARALVPKARSFGLEIIAFTPRIAADALASVGEATRDLDALLERSDYVSIHVPLTAATHGLIDSRALGLMKPTAFLINTSRGAVIDEAALYRALLEESIAGAALDVLVDEPPDPAHSLLSLDSVIVTPHMAFYSTAAIEDLARKAAENVAHVLRGEIPRALVNPRVLDRPNHRLAARRDGGE